MPVSRRLWMQSLVAGASGIAAGSAQRPLFATEAAPRPAPLAITGLTVTPIALPDPPLLNVGGCHGPYFLRNVVQLKTDSGIVGIGETSGGEGVTRALEQAKPLIVGQNAFAWRAFRPALEKLHTACYTAIELACLDACGRATGRRLCELLGGPVRNEVEFAAYLFYRYAADHPNLLADPRLVDARGRGEKALDDWGEVRTPEAMVREAEGFRKKWGFRVFKLKGGYLPPDQELETLRAMHAHFGKDCPLRIDPNGRWKTETAIRIGQGMKDLPLEYYEDPVSGQAAMAEVRRATNLSMSTNMCVTRFEHIPEALQVKPVDVVLADHHYWGGFAGCIELARMADVAGWTLSQHSNNHAGVTMAAMIHLAATIPQLTLASDTHYPWLPESDDIIAGPKLTIQGGKMPVPSGPGVGVSLDLDKLARAHEVYNKCGMRNRDDVATMKLVEPSWDRRPW
ncbi:MAG TPA: enolase C-terminal domain-like protein [Planctomycetaceae bacterium]|nr:enolase C-terminal domain-like protein [Planctomycetaceae bacterium]